MIDNLSAIATTTPSANRLIPTQRALPQDLRTVQNQDILDLSRGKGVSTSDTLDLVREKAYEKLRGVVGDARKALGIPEGAVIDTSPEATADRIVNFALGFFSKYAENNGLANDEAGRKQFADFIGAAIGQGIQEARDILSGLQVLNPETDNLIENTASIIQQRLDDFVSKGL